MTTEDYVSFETAKLLKEKGYCNISNTLYNKNGEFIRYDVGLNNKGYSSILGEFYECPTIQMAMKWLREIYKLEVRSTYDYDKDSWWGNINPMFEETDENSDTYQKALGFDYQGKSYEEACEAAIKYCLENLI